MLRERVRGEVRGRPPRRIPAIRRRKVTDLAQDLDTVRRELREIQADFYTNRRTGAHGVLDRLNNLEERLATLRSRYEQEKADEGYFDRVNERLTELEVNDRLILIYAKAGAWALGGTFVTLIGAAVVGVLRYAVAP